MDRYREIVESELKISIELYLSERCFMSALTLAGAAEGILGGLVKKSGKATALDIRKCRVLYTAKLIDKTLNPDTGKVTNDLKVDLNIPNNAAKHYADPFPEFITKQEAAKMIKRAIKNYYAIYGLKVPQFIKDFEKHHYGNRLAKA